MMILAMTIVVARGIVNPNLNLNHNGSSPAGGGQEGTTDSIRLAIIAHNKAVDDSITADSINRARKNGIDAPVTYEAKDSMIYDANTKTAFLYGKSNVKYENMDLTAAKINM